MPQISADHVARQLAQLGVIGQQLTADATQAAQDAHAAVQADREAAANRGGSPDGVTPPGGAPGASSEVPGPSTQ